MIKFNIDKMVYFVWYLIAVLGVFEVIRHYLITGSDFTITPLFTFFALVPGVALATVVLRIDTDQVYRDSFITVVAEGVMIPAAFNQQWTLASVSVLIFLATVCTTVVGISRKLDNEQFSKPE